MPPTIRKTLKKLIPSIFNRTRKNSVAVYNLEKSLQIPDSKAENKIKLSQAKKDMDDYFHSLGINPDQHISPSKKSPIVIIKSPLADTLSYLKKICPSSSDCLGFGMERATIKQLFNNFKDAKFIDKTFNRISNGANGFTNLITYTHKDYNSYAVVKSSKRTDADNLMYEGAVGLYYINTLIPYYPCFLETYDILKYKHISDLESMSNSKQSIHDFDRILEFGNMPNKLEDFDFSAACQNPQMHAVLNEYVKDPITFASFIDSLNNKKTSTEEEYYWNIEVMSVLYQVYSVLSMISADYTHYDLHLENVLLYKPSKYINMVYNYPDGSKVELKTKYIAKIIDYGRNHSPVSGKYYQYLCKGKHQKDCGPTHNIACGTERGHNYFLEKPTGKQHFTAYLQKLVAQHYINPLEKNHSCDLRLAHILRIYAVSKNNSYILKKKFLWDETKDLLEKVQYSVNWQTMMTDYGTREAAAKSGDTDIFNVNEMAAELKKFIHSHKYQDKITRTFANKPPLGTMNIYLDRWSELEFIPH